MHSRAFRGRTLLLSLVVSCFVAVACSSNGPASHVPQASAASKSPVPETRNIVFVLTDDLSWNLITPQIAPHIVALEHEGETFDHYFVADSLCCPSRSTIFTGLFPHDTHVVTNLPPNGGFTKFQSENLASRTFAASLNKNGYETSLLGKYLNGYGNKSGDDYQAPDMTAAGAPVPPGWNDWHVSNSSGYAEYDFLMNDNGKFTRYTGDDNYGVDVINRDAQRFITTNAHRPFIVEAATFAPHRPSTPAVRNANDFPGLTQPGDASFNAQNVNPPSWLGQRRPVSPAKEDTLYRKRARAVESVDKLVADTEATLAKEHLRQDTYIVFSSDNGYHLGQHRLVQGKQTAFDTDIRVPLIVAGPGVPQDRIVHDVVQNTDLAPTFEQIAGAQPAGPMEGTSLVPLLHPGASAATWPTVALVEHNGKDSAADPDYEGGGSNPTGYSAIRISAPHLPGFTGPVEAVYVEYLDAKHELEYYDINKDPYEIDNVAGQLTPAEHAELHKILTSLVNCHTAVSCRTAAVPEDPG